MADRDELLDGALRHLNAHPATSLSEVAAAIGVGRATLHRHFATRADLVRAIAERSLDRWESTQASVGIETAVASGDPEAIEQCLRRMLVELVRDAEDFAFVLTDDSLLSDPGLFARMTGLQAVEVSLLAAGQRAGLLRPDVPPAWLGHLLYGVLVAVREALRIGDIGSRSAGDLMVTTFLDGGRAR
jgi:AcrR family transcriptional regulator